MVSDTAERLRELAERLVALELERAAPAAALLTGSVSTGEADEYSDVDLILYFDGAIPDDEAINAVRDSVGGGDAAPIGPRSEDGPGAVRFAEGDVLLAPERARIRLTVTNTSERPIRVSSHFPFDQVNPRLIFDREAAAGFRLDLPAGAHERWRPGETRDVVLVRARTVS